MTKAEKARNKVLFDLITEEQYEKYRHGLYCPDCNKPMIEKTNRSNGQLFFGCPTYPECTGSRNTDGTKTRHNFKYGP